MDFLWKHNHCGTVVAERVCLGIWYILVSLNISLSVGGFLIMTWILGKRKWKLVILKCSTNGVGGLSLWKCLEGWHGYIMIVCSRVRFRLYLPCDDIVSKHFNDGWFYVRRRKNYRSRNKQKYNLFPSSLPRFSSNRISNSPVSHNLTRI